MHTVTRIVLARERDLDVWILFECLYDGDA